VTIRRRLKLIRWILFMQTRWTRMKKNLSVSHLDLKSKSILRVAEMTRTTAEKVAEIDTTSTIGLI